MEYPEKRITSNERLDEDSQQKQPPLFSSPELFGNHNEIMICHNGEIYRIRITRNGKLIMNK